MFPSEWRTQNRFKRRIYSKYMGWLEKVGYLVVLAVLGAFVFAFNYRVDDVVKADGVKIEPARSAIKFDKPILIRRLLVEDFALVTKGQILMEITQGESDVKLARRWASYLELRKELGDTPEIAQLGSKLGTPLHTVQRVFAPAAGTFRLDLKGMEAEADTVIARVVDYNDLCLTASLEGQTVPKAAIGQTARITALNLGTPDKTLFRGSSPQGPTLSGRLIGGEAKQILEDGLRGASVQLRDDMPLQISELGELQIDAKVARSAANGQAATTSLDPPAQYVIRAKVIAGTPTAVVQIADLPAGLQERTREAIRKSIQNRVVQDLDGSMAKLANADDVHLVVKLNAKGEAKESGLKLQGSMISRKFDATLKIDSPPAFLIQAVREADRNGTAVTARVELITGNRPIAFILLKKS